MPLSERSVVQAEIWELVLKVILVVHATPLARIQELEGAPLPLERSTIDGAADGPLDASVDAAQDAGGTVVGAKPRRHVLRRRSSPLASKGEPGAESVATRGRERETEEQGKNETARPRA